MNEDVPPSVALEGLINGSLDVDGTARVPDTDLGDATVSPQPKPESEAPEDEQTLEWHEVIELQAFIERKAWIEEKTKVRVWHRPQAMLSGRS